MRRAGIDLSEHNLHLFGGYAARHDCRKIAAAVADEHYLRAGESRCDFFFDGLRGDVVPGPENNQVLDAASNFPVPGCVDLALITGVKPSVAQGLSGFLW